MHHQIFRRFILGGIPILIAFTAACYGRADDGYYLALHPSIEKAIIASHEAESIHRVKRVIPFKKSTHEYLFVDISLIIPHGFEGVWHGNILVRKMADESWSEAQILHPHEMFDLSLVDYLREDEIHGMTIELFNERFLKLHNALSQVQRSDQGQRKLLEKKVYLLTQFRKGKPLNLSDYRNDFKPKTLETRKTQIDDIFPQ